MKKVLFLLLTSLISTSSFAQKELETNFGFGLNNLINQGWEIYGFEPMRSGSKTYLGSSTNISDGNNRYLRTPWLYLEPGEVEIEIESNLSNSSKRDEFQPVIYLIDILGNITTLDSEIEWTGRDLEFEIETELDIFSRGYYRFEIGHNPVSQSNGAPTTWELHEFEIEVEKGNLKWEIETWKVKMDKTISMKSNGNENNIFFVGDTIEFEYRTTIKTSADILGLEEVMFDVTYPTNVSLNRIELWINNEMATHSDDMVNWVSTPLACGCPRDVVVVGGDETFSNKLKVIRGRNNDVIRVKVRTIATNEGDFDISFHYRGGTALEVEPIIRNTIISNSSSIIGFSTQEEIPLEGDTQPTTSSGTIITNGTQPVELISFEGNVNGNTPILTWSTALEINNDFFSIERSKDGINYHSVGEVKGNGNVSGITNYEFKDVTATNGTWYYRLTQVDYNGDSKSYNAIRIVVNTKTDFNVNVLKNPSDRNKIELLVSGGVDKTLLVQLVDIKTGNTINGRISNDGSNRYVLDGLNLTNGMYVIKVTDGINVNSSKIIVN